MPMANLSLSVAGTNCNSMAKCRAAFQRYTSGYRSDLCMRLGVRVQPFAQVCKEMCYCDALLRCSYLHRNERRPKPAIVAGLRPGEPPLA